MSDEVKSDGVDPIENGKSAESEIDKKISDLEQKVEKYKNDYLYLRAEFDNFKRHAAKERSDLIKFGAERLIVDLLGVLDNFERALELKITPENLANFSQGMKMTFSELKQLLAKFGVTSVESQGAQFDPSIHEALGTEPSSTIKDGHVSQVLKKPYKMHDKVIRPGQVIIAKPIENG